MKLSTRAFLALSGVGLIGVVGVPLTFFPRAWSRVTGWEQPVETPVADYLARSLGAIGLALGATCIAGSCVPTRAEDPPRNLLLLLTMIGAGATAVHAFGARRGSYPPRERAEVPVLLAWTLWGARELLASEAPRRGSRCPR